MRFEYKMRRFFSAKEIFPGYQASVLIFGLNSTWDWVIIDVSLFQSAGRDRDQFRITVCIPDRLDGLLPAPFPR